MCCFTKYVMLFPLRRATSENIVKHLENDVFMVHGIPQTVISDNGTQFTGNEVTALFYKYAIPQIHLGPRYCPQVDPVERQNRTIVTSISALIKDDHRNWDVYLSQIQFAINTTVSDATGYSPFLLVHGREAVVSGSLYDSTPVELAELTFPSRDDYAQNLGSLAGIFRKVKSDLLKGHDRNAKYYNLRRRHVELEIGQTVWKRCFPLSVKDKFFSAKLAPKYIKCKVVEKKSPLVYRLVDCSGKDVGIWHIKDLKINN
ncbi:integrase core domain-containing protein [Phthorimaea operculella]|nr:integrase core domain-containing protein [Phthorimaea operculella]